MDLALYECKSISLNLTSLDEQLYGSINRGDLENAVVLSLLLNKFDHRDTIKEVVNRLLSNGVRTTMEYAYKLWTCGGKEIVTDVFPTSFKLILNEDALKFVNKRDGLPVKLAVRTDSDGDRQAWGAGTDGATNRVIWKMISIWESNRLYFKLFNTDQSQYLKMGYRSDDVGDRKTYGSNDCETYRHQWYLHPVKYNNEVLFYIFDRKYNQPLKLGRWVDKYRDRILWGHNGNVIGNPADFGWYIKS